MPSATASPCRMVPAGFRLDRMAEAVAEIEQRPLARPVFDVASDDPRLGLDRGDDGMAAQVRIAGEEPRPLASHQAKKAGSSIRPYLTTSA